MPVSVRRWIVNKGGRAGDGDRETSADRGCKKKKRKSWASPSRAASGQPAGTCASVQGPAWRPEFRGGGLLAAAPDFRLRAKRRQRGIGEGPRPSSRETATPSRGTRIRAAQGGRKRSTRGIGAKAGRKTNRAGRRGRRGKGGRRICGRGGRLERGAF